MQTTETRLSRGEKILIDLVRQESPLAIVGELRERFDGTRAAFDHCLISLVRRGLVALQKYGGARSGGGSYPAAPAGSLDWDGSIYHVASLR